MTSTVAGESVQVCLIGPLQVMLNGSHLDIGGGRQQRLLVALTVDAPSQVSMESLVERVWEEQERPARAEHAIRTYVSRLRRSLPDDGAAIVTTESGYRLDLDLVVRDVDRFRALFELSQREVGQERLKVLDAALEIWRGRPFGQFSGLSWTLPDAQRLDDLYTAVLEARWECLLELGRQSSVIDELQAAVDDFPYRDRPRYLLMLALYRDGRASDALSVYEEYRRELAEEVGLEPGPDLKGLEHRVLSNDPGLLATPGSERLRSYELLEQVTQDRHTTLWRGVQRSVRRQVAVKRFEAQLADSPDFIRRSELTAQAIGQIQHPNVVPLYDFWREPGAAYVIRHWVAGKTLADRLGGEPLASEEVARLIEQVGGALKAAHQSNVVHQDVRPTNILCDEDGDFYLADFSLAAGNHLVGAADRFTCPELATSSEAGPAADVFGFGRVLESILDAPSTLEKATRSRPEDRFQSIDDFLAGVAAELRQPMQAARRPAANPYKGLRTFQESDAANFFGRERLIERIADRIEGGTSLITIVGPSGSGKSSLARAGLLPRLRRADVADSYETFVAVMVPGASPFEELERALQRVSAQGQFGRAVVDDLKGGRRELAAVVEEVLPAAGSQLILLIDQFEELFTLVDEEAVRERFLDLLSFNASLSQSPVTIMLTLRADFWGHPLRYSRFGRAMEQSAFHLVSMDADEVSRAVEEPAQRAGCEVESALVAQISADLADRPGALPLLQFALRELFDRREGSVLTLASYQQLGGMAGALTARADSLAVGVGSDGRGAAVRSVFTRLVTLGDGAADTRRRVDQAELLELPLASEVLGRFSAARLLTFDRHPVTREPTVEIAHEALINRWGLLRTWIDEDRDNIRIHRQITVAAGEWENASFNEGDLLSGTRLDIALDWRERSNPVLTTAEREFLDASCEAQTKRQELEKQRVARLRRLLLAAGVLLVLSMVAGSVAAVQQQRATNASAIAETRRLISEAPRAAETSREIGLLLAAEAYRRDPSPESLGALQSVLVKTGSFLGLLGADGDYGELLWSPDGRVLYAGSETGVDALDPLTGSVQPIYKGATGRSIAVDPSGATVAVATLRDGVQVIDVDSGNVVAALDANGPPTAVAFSPDGRQLAVGDRDGWIALWDWQAGTQSASTHAHPERDNDDLPADLAYPLAARHESTNLSVGVEDVRFTSTGSAVVTTGGIFLRSFDAETLERGIDVPLDREQITGGERIPARPTAVDIDDATNTAYVAAGQDAQVIDLATGEVLTTFLPARLPGSAPDQFTLALAQGLVVTSTVVGEVNILDRRTGRVVDVIDSELTGTARGGIDLAVSPDGRTLAVAGIEGVKLFSLDGRGLISRSVDHPEWGHRVSVSADGDTLLWSGLNRAPAFFDIGAASPQAIEPAIADAFTGHVDEFGEPVVVTSATNGLSDGWYLDPDTFQPTGRRAFGPAAVLVGDVSPDGSLVAHGRAEPDSAIVDVRDRTTGELVASIPPAFDEELSFGINGLAWSPDQARLAALTAPFGVVVYDTSSWEAVSPPIAQGAVIADVVFSPDGRWIVTADTTGLAIVRDAETYQPTGIEVRLGTTGDGAADGPGLTFTPDGRYMLSAIDEPRLVDVESWQVVGGPFPSERGFHTLATQDAQYVPTVVDGKVVVWDLDPSSWSEIACRAAGRNLTEAEWTQFGPADRTLNKTCAQWD